MDVYRDYIAEGKGEKHYVMVGRATALAAMAIALVLAQPFLGGMESAFQTIQEYTGFIAPGVVAIFLLGFFYRPANKTGAFAVLISSVVGQPGAQVRPARHALRAKDLDCVSHDSGVRRGCQ